MDSQISDNLPTTISHCCQSCCVSTPVISHIDLNSTDGSDYAFDINDRTTLITNCVLKNKKHYCQCSTFNQNKSKIQYSQPWITFFQILCSATLVVLAIYLSSNILVFEKKPNGKEIDDIEFRLSIINQHDLLTTPTISTTELPVSKDKCEPLYVLVYAHCCVWFLFLVLDHVCRHLHHKALRHRGHLRAYVRISRLAAIPFQLVSLWTVLLAIFIAVYAQQDEADLQPYCDANLLMSPKNGIAVLLIIEFICVSVSSLLYANSIRKFSINKPPPDVYGWEDINYYNRWSPRVFLNSDISNQQLNFGEFLNYERRDGTCLLDLLEYYAHTNRELSTILGRTSQRLRQLEVENQSQLPCQP